MTCAEKGNKTNKPSIIKNKPLQTQIRVQEKQLIVKQKCKSFISVLLKCMFAFMPYYKTKQFYFVLALLSHLNVSDHPTHLNIKHNPLNTKICS